MTGNDSLDTEQIELLQQVVCNTPVVNFSSLYMTNLSLASAKQKRKLQIKGLQHPLTMLKDPSRSATLEFPNRSQLCRIHSDALNPVSSTIDFLTSLTVFTITRIG